MRTSLQAGFGPSSTPKAIQAIIAVTALTTLILALTQGLVRYLTGISNLANFVSLTYEGVSTGFIWQLITYFFLYNSLEQGITLALIIPLAFHMYLLWIAGTAIAERQGVLAFLKLYLTTGVLAGLAAVIAMGLIGWHPVISGAAAPLLAVLIVWSMMYPDMELMLFLTLPVKAAWLIFGYLGIVLLIDLSQLNIVDLCFMSTSAVVGYLFATAGFALQSPFPVTHRFDALLNSFGDAVRQRRSHRQSGQSKIVPLHPEPTSDSDEAFLDAMLTKISAQGENSLTWRERRRLHRISKAKKDK